MELLKNRSLLDIKEKVSERFLGSDQDHVHISELGLAFERSNPYNDSNQGIYIYTFKASTTMLYIKQQKMTIVDLIKINQISHRR